MSKIVFKACTIPFFAKIIVDGQETLQQFNIAFAQGTVIDATLAAIDEDPIIEYSDMFAYFNEEHMEVINEEQPRTAPCCSKDVEEN